MAQTVVLSPEQAAMFAAAILPDIHAYINAHKEEYEEFLRCWNERHKGESHP